MSRGGATWSSPMHAGMQVQQSWTPCWLTPAACLETSTSKTSKCLEARPVRPRVHLPTLSLLPLFWVATVPLVLADTREDAEGKYNSFDDRKICGWTRLCPQSSSCMYIQSFSFCRSCLLGFWPCSGCHLG